MDKISRTLCEMGSVQEEIAATLLAAEVRGVKDSPWMNPLIVYLNKGVSTKGKLEVAANGTVLRLHRSTTTNEFCLSPAAQRFLKEFNLGRYPALEAVKGSE